MASYSGHLEGHQEVFPGTPKSGLTRWRALEHLSGAEFFSHAGHAQLVLSSEAKRTEPSLNKIGCHFFFSNLISKGRLAPFL